MKKILVVDDDKDIVETLRLRLEAKDFQVEVAYDGVEGLNKAKGCSPDLIILDVALPKMDGYHICRLLKFDSNFKEIPIIMLTAKAQAEDKEWGEKTGADRYITKPFNSDELLTNIDELLRK